MNNTFFCNLGLRFGSLQTDLVLNPNQRNDDGTVIISNVPKPKKSLAVLCLVLLQVPKCFGLVQIFCARAKTYLHVVVVTNILCQTKR